MLLEICAYNIQSCLIAEKAGASRIELCASPMQGGTTPSIGTIRYALEHLSIPAFPIIRARGGNYFFSEEEMEIMRRDIIACKDLGSKGIATGALRADSTIDTDELRRMVDLAYPMAVTCHKAFDETPDPFKALDDLINAGCARVLSSGLKKTALEGAELLAQLMKYAAGRIIIMPGGGVRSAHLAELVSAIGANEYHSSGIIAGSSDYTGNEDEIRKMVAALI
jgi:copper homeostasis protein